MYLTLAVHDWSKYINYVVTELEKNTTEGAAAERELEMREKIREIIPCNIRSDNFIDSKSQTSNFDIIHTNLCLEIACETTDEFSLCVSELGKRLKSGGYLICLTAKGGAWYTCAGAGSKLFQLVMDEEKILKAFDGSGRWCELVS